MEGTLSLLDWRPGSSESAAPAEHVLGLAEGSGPTTSDGDGDAKPKKARARARAKLAVENKLIKLVDPTPELDARTMAAPVAALAVVRATAVAEAAPQVIEAAPPLAVVAAPTVLTGPQPRIVIFDCETTGTDRTQDQVIELCVQHGLGDDAPSQTWRIRPTTATIHPGAQAVHGIALADLANAPTFAEVADAIVQVFAEVDVIVGYNLAFDIDMLQAELTRLGRPLLDLNGKKIVDPFRLWQQCEPRSLQHAHQRFVGNEFASAHSASADVAATGRVLSGMLRAFNLIDHDWDAVAGKCDPQHAARASWVGPSRHLRWESEIVVLGFGKHANTPVHQLASGPDRSFLRWVLDRDFPVHVAEVARAALEMAADEFLAWARQKYPPPATASAK